MYPFLTWPEEYPSPDLAWRVPHPDLAGGYPIPGYPPPGTGGSPWKGPGTSHWGTPRKDMGTVEVLWDGEGVPPRKDMGPVEILWDGDGVPPGVNRLKT